MKRVGEGAVAYVALGHCHSPSTNGQPFVDTSVDADGKTPLTFRGPWEVPAFETLLRRHENRVLRVLRLLCVPRADREDES